MLARRPLQWQSSLVRAAVGISGFNQTLLVDQKFCGWLYLNNYSKFCFALRENINSINCANFTVV